MGEHMRASTKALVAKHGRRIDRAIHNYLYFSFYYPYVKFVYQPFAFLAKYLSWFKPLSPVIKVAFARYHAEVISGDCPCKKSLNAPEWTINSCIGVGRKTSQFWLDRCGKKYHARKIFQKEAIDLVKNFREKGYVTQAFFKVATGGSAGIICNCHIGTCVSLQATCFARRQVDRSRLWRRGGQSGRKPSSPYEDHGSHR